MSEKHGGPAFPQSGGVEQLESRLPVQGMTLRDYFAAKAMQGLIAGAMSDGARWGQGDEKNLAIAAFFLSDAMLEASK